MKFKAMNKRSMMIGSFIFIFILLMGSNFHATEYQIMNKHIENQIENICFDTINEKDFKYYDIWDLLEFLHSLLIGFMNFIINFIR
jgi:hypothetical protein